MNGLSLLAFDVAITQPECMTVSQCTAWLSLCPVQIENNRKYAKWKAAYIHRCLKSGETPLPGPLPGDKEGACCLFSFLRCLSVVVELNGIAP